MGARSSRRAYQENPSNCRNTRESNQDQRAPSTTTLGISHGAYHSGSSARIMAHSDDFVVPNELIRTFTPQELERIAFESSLAYSPLPFGWEKTSDSKGNTYFIDYYNKVTTFEDPRLNYYTFKSKEAPPAYESTFYSKCQHLRALLFKNNIPDTREFLIKIRRQSVYEDSFRLLRNQKISKLISRLRIEFEGEKGLDYGGMSREWFLELSGSIVSPKMNLFYLKDGYDYLIDPKSDKVPNYLEHFEFIGLIIGLCIYHGMLLPCKFTDSFYKNLLHLPLELEDMKYYDKEIYKSFNYILECENVAVLDLNFIINDEDKNAFFLKESGDTIQVNNSNREEYIKLCIEYYLESRVKKQYEAIKRGFRKIIPKGFLCRKGKKFEENQLNSSNITINNDASNNNNKHDESLSKFNAQPNDKDDKSENQARTRSNNNGNDRVSNINSRNDSSSMSSNRNTYYKLKKKTSTNIDPDFSLIYPDPKSNGLFCRQITCPIYVYMNHFELKTLMCGIELIDVHDLKLWSQYENYTGNEDVINWFWETVFEMDQKTLACLLHFVTGTPNVPVGGFEHLYGSDGPHIFTIAKVDFKEGILPSAHSCFNRIDIPVFPTKEILKKSLLYAITETRGFDLE